MAIRSLVPYREFVAPTTLEQYKRSPKLRGLINSVLNQLDDAEDALFELLQMLDPETAIGPALDYIGEIIGVTRTVGESDAAYRVRIFMWRDLEGIPAPESLRRALRLLFNRDKVGLYPCWPAGMYFVLDGETPQDMPTMLADYFTSGTDIGAGTFLIAEDGEDFGYIVNEDTGTPFVMDYRWADALYVLVNEADEELADENGEELAALDYLTTPTP